MALTVEREERFNVVQICGNILIDYQFLGFAAWVNYVVHARNVSSLVIKYNQGVLATNQVTNSSGCIEPAYIEWLGTKMLHQIKRKARMTL